MPNVAKDKKKIIGMPVYSAFPIMTKLPNDLKRFWLFFYFGNWNLFGAWCLEFGILF